MNFFPIYFTSGKRFPDIPYDKGYLEWTLQDDQADSVVTGDIPGVLTGGNTEDVTEILDGKRYFHFNGTSQYVTIPLTTKMRSDEIARLWNKYAGNPVIQEASAVEFGNIVANPSGGWWAFMCFAGDVVRYSSADLITWTDRTEVLSAVPGAWDASIEVCHAFRMPDTTWKMLYRGNGTLGFTTGLATSPDGTTWTRRDNSGVNDGLFQKFGGNYDPTCVMLIGSTYYVYVNGSPSHDHTNIYYSDDFETFTAYANNPVFNNGFCPTVWKTGADYYMIICRDIIQSTSAIYDHGLALYRCSDQFFQYGEREYLGYVTINDQAYDDRYVDTPTVPMTDIERDTYPAEFGDTFYCMYTGDLTGATQNLLTSTLSGLAGLTPIPESATEVWAKTGRTVMMWCRFDTMVASEAVYSIGTIPTDSSPAHKLMVSGANPLRLVLYINGGNRECSNDLAVDTLYHFTAVEDLTNWKFYTNGVLIGTIAHHGFYNDCIYLYIGKAGNYYFDGYMRDFRFYSRVLSQPEIAAIYHNS